MPRNDIEAPVLHKARVAPSIASAPAFSPLTLQTARFVDVGPVGY
jgi:hypothetical protein